MDMNVTSGRNPLVYEGLDSFSQAQVEGRCQPFEFECCSTCTYSSVTESGATICSIRGRPVGRPNLSYCANQSSYNPGAVTIPVGPPRIVRHFHVSNECWYVSPSVKANPDLTEGVEIVRLLEQIHDGSLESTLVVNRALAFEAAEASLIESIPVLMRIAGTSEAGDDWWSVWLPFDEASRALSKLSKAPEAREAIFVYAREHLADSDIRRVAARLLRGGKWASGLTARDLAILDLIGEGQDYSEMGETLLVASMRMRQFVERLAGRADEHAVRPNEGHFIREVGGV